MNAVIRPENEAELAAFFTATSGPIALCGGQTRRPGGAVPPGVQPLSLGAFSGITTYEPGALILTAGAGTPLAEIEAALAAENQMLAFEPPDFRALLSRSGTPTLGGAIAMNAAGPRRLRAGAARDHVLGLRVVTGRGEILRCGGRVLKNVTGLDLVRLFTGSEGRLGAITEVCVKLQPRPEAQISLLLPRLAPGAALAALAAAAATPYEVSGAAYLPTQGAFLRVEGFAETLRARAERLAAALAGHGRVEVLAKGENPWPGLRDGLALAAREGDLWRLVARPSAMVELIEKAGVGPEDWQMDWAGGLAFLRLPPGTDLPARLGAFAGAARGLSGAAALRPAARAPGIVRLEEGLRRAFDPRGIFGPGGEG